MSNQLWKETKTEEIIPQWLLDAMKHPDILPETIKIPTWESYNTAVERDALRPPGPITRIKSGNVNISTEEKFPEALYKEQFEYLQKRIAAWEKELKGTQKEAFKQFFSL